MKVLDKYYKTVYDSVMSGVKFEKVDCWNMKIPKDFENHEPCEDSKKW